LYPIYFTIKTAFTNYGTGHIFTRQESLEKILYDPNYTYVVDKKPINFKIFTTYDNFKPTEDFVLLFNINNETFIGTVPVPVKQRGREILLREGKLYKLSTSKININGNVYEFIPEPSFSKIEKIISTNKIYKPLYSLNDNNLEKSSYYFTLLIQKFLANAEYITPEGKIISVKVDEDGKWKFFTIERLYRLTYEDVEENGQKDYKNGNYKHKNK